MKRSISLALLCAIIFTVNFYGCGEDSISPVSTNTPVNPYQTSALPVAFTTSGTTMYLTADGTTDQSIIIPDGFTLDGQGFTITAIDPTGGHFVGGVIQNGGTSANVKNVKINTSSLSNVCDAGVNRLRGILFDGASGFIKDCIIDNINQGVSGCQEGNAIEVRNLGSNPNTCIVTIEGNIITNYQKTGIIVNGNVSGTIKNNTVTGEGPVGYIAQNGIQIGFGATAKVQNNTVTGNSYTGSSAVSGGILLVGGPYYGGDFVRNCHIVNNTLNGNDVGVYMSQYNLDFSTSSTPTNNKVTNNNISHNSITNGYVYQAGVSVVGNKDKIIANTVNGSGYDYSTIPGSTFEIDADPSYAVNSKVHANK